MSTPPHLLRSAIAVTALVAALALAPSATAATPAERWLTFSSGMAEPWPGLQRENGSFRDYVTTRPNRYGDAMMGYALIQTGLRDRDRKLIDSGIRGIGRAVRNERWRTSVSAFEVMGIAASYRLGRARLDSNDLFTSERSVWADWLRKRAKIEELDRPGYFNHHLVEAVAVFEVLKTGLHSREPGAMLADPSGARRKAERIINEVLPYVASRTTRTVAGHATAIISDPPTTPLAYHGLAAGFLARAIDLMGRRATSSARYTLVKALNASWILTAPDGNLAYYGRSNEEAWALAFTAYAAERVGASARSSSAARMRALSERALRRMRDRHGVGPRGLWIVPAFRDDLEGARKAVDGYANAPAFAGLAMTALNWTHGSPEAFRERGREPTRPTAALLDARGSELGVISRSDNWYAVKTAPRSRNGDLRYDFGVLALKARKDDTWRDAMPIRPTAGGESAGPLLLRAGQRGVPVGRAARMGRDGSLSVRTDFVGSRGVLRKGVLIRFLPTGCGVRVVVPARTRDSFEYSGFYSSEPRTSTRTVRNGRLILTPSETGSATVEGKLHSATDAHVWRGRMTVAPTQSTVRFGLCAR